jgi:hypothetical protein
MSSNTIKTRDQGLDKFYTKKNISKMCIETLSNMYNFNSFDLIVEPSAGDGSFYNQIDCKSDKIGIDIMPENENIIKKDFFEFIPDKKYDKILTIGNPPFGKISSTAVKFFNHASIWSTVIAFIIPKTFRKTSIQNRLDPCFHLVQDIDIPDNPCSFEPYMNVKCCFQIWIKKNTKRNKIILDKEHSHWVFLPYGPKDEKKQPTPPKGADFALRAYGGKCGQIITENLETLRPKSWHFIKMNKESISISINDFIKRFEALDYSNSKNTARQNSIGKSELVNLYISKFQYE